MKINSDRKAVLGKSETNSSPAARNKLLKAEFESLTRELIESKGQFGLYIKDLQMGNVYEYNQNKTFYGASLYKLIVAGSVFSEIDKRNLTYHQTFRYLPDDFESGTGVIANNSYGKEYTVEELLELLLKQSDNVAQNILTRAVGKDSQFNFFVSVMGKGNSFVDEVVTSPAEVSDFIEKLYLGDYLSQDSKRVFFKMMTETAFDDRIHSGLSPSLKFSHKIGSWGASGSWHDCGVVLDIYGKEVLVCFMSEDVTLDNFVPQASKVGEFVNKIYYTN